MKIFVPIVTASFLLLAGCAPEVGSKKWCEQLDEKDKGEWTVDEVRDYAKYCLLENYTDEDD
ncbi:MAG TPA: DUF3012 domain-containing protein [Woeseiaceae bacterium]|jgi:hypothetical protein|nr:DUF3012 domain-containing protein [Woeseiaceae bacterium]